MMGALLGFLVTACGGGSDASPTNDKVLTISKLGTGTGSVTSSPSGIACGSDCKEPYNPGTVVALTATPDPSSKFSGWSGDADCSDGSVTMSTDIACTATFDKEGTPPPTTSLFFQSGSISALDPADPAAPPVVIESAATQEAQGILHGTIDFTNQKITGIHTRTIIYANIDDGKLYKIDTSKPPVPVQVSNETGGAAFCDPHGAENEPDLSDHGKSVYIYQVPGNDGSCFTTDDVWKMVRLNMTASDSPITAKPIVTVLNDTSTGAIIGFLAFEGNKLVGCDQNFLNCSDVLSFTTDAEELGSNFSGDVILLVDDKLFHYDESTGVLSPPLHFLGASLGAFSDGDGTNLYFEDGNKIFKLPMDGSANASLFQTEPPGNTIEEITVTPNNVVYTTTTNSVLPETTLKVASKSGGAATDLIPATTDTLSIFTFIAGDSIYYDRASSTTHTRGVIKDDGTGNVEIPNAGWLGLTGSTILLDDGIVIEKMIWAEGCSFDFPFCAGATLKSIDAATQSGELVLGTIPSDIQGIGFFGLFGSVGGILGSGPATAGLFENDIFFVNPDQANSLKRITTTPDFSELPIGE